MRDNLTSIVFLFGIVVCSLPVEAHAGPPDNDGESDLRAGQPTSAPLENQHQDQPVARVGETTFTHADLWSWVKANPRWLKSFGTQAGRDAVLHEMIASTLVLAAAEDRFAADPKLSEATEAHKIRVFRRRFLSLAAEIPIEDVRAHYDEHPERFGIPPQVRIAELHFPVSDRDARAEALVEAQRVYDSLTSGAATFEDLAAQYGFDEPSRLAGGDRGFLSLASRPLLAELTAAMSVGDTSAPVDLGSGFSIVQLIDRRAGLPAEFEDVKAAVANNLRAQREAELLDQFLVAEARDRGVAILDPDFAAAWTWVEADDTE